MKNNIGKKQGWRWNWGTGIFIVFSLFVVGILTMVTGAFRQNIELEATDYYARELKFQDQIDKLNRSKKLSNPLKVTIEKEQIVLYFPFETGINGQLELFRPSDARHDKLLPIKTDAQGKMIIPTVGYKAGAYRLKINWVHNDTTFYDEQVLMIK
jgi:hypothetical protein